MKKITYYLALTIILGLAVGFTAAKAQATDILVERDGSVLLPEQRSLRYNSLTMQDLSKEWNSFIEENGAWTIITDESTGTPHRAFGKAIKIDGYNKINRDNVEEAAMSFLQKHASRMKINPDNLRLRRVTEVNGRWYVSYYQVYNDMKVLLSEVELRIFSNGNVMAFGADYYNNIDISPDPSISVQTAMESAAKGLNLKVGKDQTLSSGKLYILPVKYAGGVD